MAADQQQIVVICCGVFQAEVEALMIGALPDLAISFQNSMLHMKPEKLGLRLAALVTEELRQRHKVLLVYGDCSLRLAELEALPGVVRVRGNNCCDLLLGSETYRRLSHEGAFFLFPEWIRRWRHIFSVELGLNHDNASSLMGDMHKKLVYLDTGVMPVPEDELNACASYCGLPWEALPVSLEPLRSAIHEALHTLATSGEQP